MSLLAWGGLGETEASLSQQHTLLFFHLFKSIMVELGKHQAPAAWCLRLGWGWTLAGPFSEAELFLSSHSAGPTEDKDRKGHPG